ncbi:hypothetical protein [Xanthomonas fragariae]|uniref:hypothetical protein n=1 Tax=Xanthomonas fragariae TaxID=48664 RepID=UPI001ABDE20D|nr:hypothetical protein [Xanthomonas fragariae]UKR51649.1 hypothetical protein K4A87_12665 [Xanthomonas fragariae]WAT13813.1 hypothetical protein OZ429_11690 [Xanthomonas fragariae]
MCGKAVDHVRALDVSIEAAEGAVKLDKKYFDSIDGFILGIYGKIGNAKGVSLF